MNERTAVGQVFQRSRARHRSDEPNSGCNAKSRCEILQAPKLGAISYDPVFSVAVPAVKTSECFEREFKPFPMGKASDAHEPEWARNPSWYVCEL
jgi:hypothetical protein